MGKCASGAVRVLTAHGAVERIDALVERADPSTQVLALDEAGRLRPVPVSEFHENGVRDTYRVCTRSGRSIKVTDNHLLLTWRGWRELRDLGDGDLIAVPRTLPVFGTAERAGAEVVLLGYLLGDGCLRGSQPELTTESPVIEAEAV